MSGPDRESVGVRLRPATPEDTERVAAIWAPGWVEAHEGRVPDELLEHRSAADLRNRVPSMLNAMTVAVIDGEVAGFVVVEGDAVDQLYLDGGLRGKGIAGRLLAHGESEIAAAGHDRAWLAVVAGNEHARRFYASQGWKDCGTFDHITWTTDGRTIPVPCRRYEKVVRRRELD